jgi:hypothetical protein
MIEEEGVVLSCEIKKKHQISELQNSLFEYWIK